MVGNSRSVDQTHVDNIILVINIANITQEQQETEGDYYPKEY